MKLKKIFSFVVAAGLAFSLTAPPAPAQGSFGFGYSRYGNHSGFSVGFSAPIYPHYYYRPYYRPYYSRPVIVDRSYASGYWETRNEQVWVPGTERRVWVEPQYEVTRDPNGDERRMLVREGYWKTVQDAGRYETRTVQVWVPTG